MLDQAFVRSQKLRGCSRDARLAYAMILPFLDREGRCVAEPLVLKAVVFRWSDYTLEEVACCVVELERAGLLTLYSDPDNAAILEYVNFRDFNSPNTREAQSAFPGKDSDLAGDVYDDLLLAARGEHGRCTEDARAMHVQGQFKVEGNGTLTERLTINGKEENTHVDGSEPPSQLLEEVEVEATPRRARVDFHLFEDAWEQNRGPLPRLLKLNDKRREALRKLVRENGGDVAAALDLFRDATLAVAHDEFWQRRQYGFDNLMRQVDAKAEQWRNGGMRLSEADRRMALETARMAAALEDDDGD